MWVDIIDDDKCHENVFIYAQEQLEPPFLRGRESAGDWISLFWVSIFGGRIQKLIHFSLNVPQPLK